MTAAPALLSKPLNFSLACGMPQIRIQQNKSGIETSMSHDVQTVRSFEHPGEGRKRAKSTPKGRQIDPLGR